MDLDHLGPEAWTRLEEIVGYLNFSSGAEDSRFLANLNALFGEIQARLDEDRPDGQAPSEGEPAWAALERLVRAGLDRLRGTSEAFRQTEQADAALRLVFGEALPAYRRHHRDLLFHQTDQALFQPFFLGRVCEAVLAEGGPWDESDRIVEGALRRLNDFLGHRPVAVLETRQKHEPYAHERVRPIPLYIAGAGVAVGQYHDVISQTLAILRSTDPSLLERAWFDPELLDELALDPRAYDFDHPVNRRPNYHFGGWDPHHLDNQGRYRRFVLHQVTLDALWSRLAERGRLPRDEVLFEAAAVLAGTMLMGSGVTGSGPDSHDSSTTLATLLPVIASYRDAFYELLVAQLPDAHARRLRPEAAALHQPFGGARQHLNQALARRRAEQLQHVHLARLFARMGYTEAAERQSRVVPVASARVRCEIDCRLSAAHLEIDRGRLDSAAALLPEIEDLLDRAIECGALVDPWNILGFGGQFSLFPAVENSVHDHRIDELIELLNDLFALYARLEKELAASGRSDVGKRLSDNLAALARWWDQFASTEVSDVEGVSGRQAWESAGQVAGAIAAWHEAGTAAGDIAFWKKHVQQFHSPEAFALLAETLIDRRDLVASMALLMLWLSRADAVSLAEGEHSFYALAMYWMEQLWGLDEPDTPPQGSAAAQAVGPEGPWPLIKKFFDYLEANADDYWQVPRLELVGDAAQNGAEDDEEHNAEEGLFGAAYESVTYRDTTDDGFEGEMLEGGPVTDFELSAEADRISRRLALLATVARLWKTAAAASAAPGVAGEDRDAVLGGWLRQALVNHRELLGLLSAVHRYRLPAPSSALDAMVEYDRRRGIKDSLLERIIAASVETADAGRFILATIDHEGTSETPNDWELPARRVLRAMFRGDVDTAREVWPELLETLKRQPLLYVPTARGGNPQRIVASRSVQQTLWRLLTYAPRLGLLGETYDLIETVQEMERNHPAGPGAITEFDRLFEIGCRGIVESLVVSWEDWPGRSDIELVDSLERAAEHLLHCWMSHSRNIRISVLETVARGRRWQGLKKFIRRYGHDLFTQRFMNYGNLRAILHQGADAYLGSLEEESDRLFTKVALKLLDDLDRRIPRDEAVGHLELAIEAVVEHYAEYIDYNSTTTQSDRGEMLYTLLDFLRLVADYDRVAWNLRPVEIVHEVLIRRGHNGAAQVWHEAVARRTASVADDHLRRFRRLTKQYGMRLPSVAERLEQRFVGSLVIDRLAALVPPAIEELQGERPQTSFPQLEREVARFTEEPGGGGFDVPAWLEALEEEVDRVHSRVSPDPTTPDPLPQIPRVLLSPEEVERQLEAWEE
ncbi:MAG: hypothetical protein ABIK89_21280 [Planctomycetota bacterium]